MYTVKRYPFSFVLLILAIGFFHFFPASWEILDMPTDAGFTAIWAIDEQTIFVAGKDGLWKTFDGGSWELDTVYLTSPASIYFANDTLGFTRGDWLTTDGGYTWVRSDTVNGIRVVRVSFPQGLSMIGYGIGDDTYKTTDGGWHWEQLPLFPDIFPTHDEEVHPLHVCFPSDPDTGYVTVDIWKIISHDPLEVDPYYSYFKTTDGGQTWVLYEKGLNDDNFNPGFISFPENASVGYMTGGGKVYKTTNGGASWDTVLKDLPHIASICFPETDQVGYVFGDSLAHKTTDGGQTWQQAVITHDSIWGHSHFLDNNLGFVTGKGPEISLAYMPYYPGFVLKTTDGLLWIEEEDWADNQPTLVEISAPSVFTDHLLLHYEARQSGRMLVKVFDATGRQVTETESRVSSGERNYINIDSGHLSPGVYFVRAEFASDQEIQTRSLRTIKVR